MNIHEIIEFENENTSLDFKAVQYSSAMHEAFLKDIMSMANANIEINRLIICGVKHNPNGKKEFLGIKQSFTDSSTYQQLVHDNIEPEVKVEYEPVEFNNVMLGIIKIVDCDNQPYMMKKDFKDLKKGDSFIRKGTYQTKIRRSDIDTIFEKRLAANSFNDEVDCCFSKSNSGILNIEINKDLQFPSDLAKEKIAEILIEKEQILLKQSEGNMSSFAFDLDIPVMGGTPYENRSTKTLRKNLENADKTFKEDDLWYLYNDVAHRLDFTFTNRSDKYLEDVSIEIIFPKLEGLMIYEKVPTKPTHGTTLDAKAVRPASYEMIHYPLITKEIDCYKHINSIGDLKHNLPIIFPEVPIRILFEKEILNKEILIEIRLHAKNLKLPRNYYLTIVAN
jgi:hypothetical protein